jgi:hypothetical protein
MTAVHYCEPVAWEPLRGNPLTVVALLKSPGSFLMAADSQATDANYKFLASKLDHLDTPPIAWGVAGNSGLAQEFAEWMGAYQWDGATWDDLKSRSEAQLATLNGNWRRLQRVAGKKPNSTDFTSALIAGYLDGQGRVLKLTDRSPGEFIDRDSFTAVGSGEFHAVVASRTLSEFYRGNGQRLPQTRNILSFIVQMAILTDPGCGPPIHGLDVGPDNVTVWTLGDGGPESAV